MSSEQQTEYLANEMKPLDARQHLAFGILVAERAMTAFEKFQEETSHHGGGYLRAAVGQCWDALENGLEVVNWIVSAEQCSNVIPDSENYGSPYASAAIDAGVIVCNLLEFLANKDPELISQCVTARTDTIDVFVQNSTNFPPYVMRDVSPEDVENHPLMHEELGLMVDDLAFLKAEDSGSRQFFALVLRRVRELEYRRLRLHG